MSDPQAEYKNFFCSLCKRRFSNRPSTRDHVYDAHQGKRAFILKYVETVFADDVETINEGFDIQDDQDL